MRARTLGNSPTALQHSIQEEHSEAWMRKHLLYLSDCASHIKGQQRLSLPQSTYVHAVQPKTLPKAKWFLASYVRDVYSGLPTLLAAVTSVYGSILKIDSTKKICRKLQGAAANTASWCTNVGNENGEILISVLTTSESTDGLKRMADGQISRFQSAVTNPPKLLYTDRECCRIGGDSKLKQLFGAWVSLQV